MSFAAIVISVMAVVSALALGGKLSSVRGVAPGGIVNTVLLLLFQTGWAFTYWLTTASDNNGAFERAALQFKTRQILFLL